MALPDRQQAAWEQLRLAFDEAHDAVMSLFEIKREAYAAASEFVRSNDLAAEVDLEFGVELWVENFAAAWIDMVNRQRLTQMPAGFDELDDRLLIDDATALHDRASLFDRITLLVDRLTRERGASDGTKRALSVVMRQGYSAAQLLEAMYGLTWLEGRYVIRSGGAELSGLSPGQRGLVLLMFYLLVDKSERPLLLDQPEGNLDNQTVKATLVPALRDAITRRQVIAVTHSPNLAIVGDADQIVVASINGGAFQYLSGSLASVDVGRLSIDVLEGTRAAFDNRRMKYQQVVGD
jgi:hypothetical protein